MRITTTRAVAMPQTRHVRGRMNKTEAAYADNLELRRLAGEIVAWRFEAIGLRLAKKTAYHPDFQVILDDGTIELHEVKGSFIRDDSIVKLKVAAESYPEYRFILAVGKRRAGAWAWDVKEVGV